MNWYYIVTAALAVCGVIFIDVKLAKLRKKKFQLCRGGEPHLWTRFEPVQHHRTGSWRHCKRCGVEQRYSYEHRKERML